MRETDGLVFPSICREIPPNKACHLVSTKCCIYLSSCLCLTVCRLLPCVFLPHPPFPLLFLYQFPFSAITHDYPTFSKGLTAFDTPPNHYHSCSNHAMVDDRSPSSRIIGVTVCIDGRLWLVSSLYLKLIFYRPGACPCYYPNEKSYEYSL